MTPPCSPLLVISPHLDDGVLSVGRWLAAQAPSIVLTLFAGLPPADLPLTDWDRRCGFHSGPEAVRLRRQEDARALQVLGAQPRWLDFLDAQYTQPLASSQLCAAIGRELRELQPRLLLIPMGLYHEDHQRTHEAALQAWREHGKSLPCWLYEDAIYRRQPGLLQQRLAELAAQGLQLTPLQQPAPRGAAARKRRALRCYESQRAALGAGLEDAAAAERCWQLQRCGP